VQREALVLMIPAATAVGERQPLTRVIEAAMPAAPENTTLGRVEFRDGAPMIVQFNTRERPQRTFAVYVDPVSLAVLGTPDLLGRGDVMRSIQQLHEFLWLPPITGLKVVGWVGVAMTFMGISGLILWWPRGASWRNSFWLRRGAKGLRLHLDLHHVFGFWGSAILLILSISGLYLTFTETFSAVARATLPGEAGTAEPPPGFVQPHGPVDADAAVRLAATAVLDAKPFAIQLPEREGRPVVVYFEATGFGPTVPPILVTMDQQTSEVGYIDDPRVYSIRDQFMNWQYALHFGVGVSWLWKFLVFLSGLLPLLLAITGASIWWMKRRATRRVDAAEGVTAPAE